MRPMRRGFQEVADQATLERWLDEAVVGRLATIDAAGYPSVRPLCFVYLDGRVYFHSAPEGEKLDDIRREPRVGFEIDRLVAITPPPDLGCGAHAFYQSVVARGRARLLEAAADLSLKEAVLRALIRKYAPAVEDLTLEGVKATAVVEITLDTITGKEDFGQRWSAERRTSVARLLREQGGTSAAEALARLAEPAR